MFDQETYQPEHLPTKGNTMNLMKTVLALGGPADGLRITLDMRSTTYRYTAMRSSPAKPASASPCAVPSYPITDYAIGTVQGAFHEVFHVAVQNLSDCVTCALLAGYRKPQGHYTDLNVAEQLVTFLGGDSDGRQMVIPNSHDFARPNKDTYQIVVLFCKEGRTFRVGVLDAISVDPIKLLHQGYRVGVAG